jgi:hypothetical protein
VSEGLGNQLPLLRPPVTGSFIHPDTAQKTSFSGVLYPKQQLITGWFPGGPQGGGFSMEANPEWEVTPQDAAALGVRLPKISFLTPRSLQVLPENTTLVTVTGSASHSSGISEVQWQLLRDGVISDPVTATGTTRWSFGLPVATGEGGLFHIFAKALATSGERSNVISRSFRIVQNSPLEVRVEGPGTVTKGYPGITSREVGKLYKITATPLRGKRFLGWTGTQTSSARTLSFLMREGFVAEAQFAD